MLRPTFCTPPPAYYEVPWRGTSGREGGPAPTMGHGIPPECDMMLSILGGEWGGDKGDAGRLDREVETGGTSPLRIASASPTRAMASVVNRRTCRTREQRYMRFTT
ncbi:hypothetical protein GCM10018965_004100 [Nonomuraea roseola]